MTPPSGTPLPAKRAIRPLRAANIGLLLALSGMAPADAASSPDCTPGAAIDYICGVRNAEDLVPIDGTSWVLAGQLVGKRGRPGGFYLIDAKDRRVIEAAPDFSRAADRRYAGCPGAPDPKLFAAHGIGIRPGGRRREIYAVNHGGRESIEVFDLDTSAPVPTLFWKGCIVVPDAVSANAVAPLPDGGFAVTSFGERTDSDSLAKMAAGKPTGFVVTWRPEAGWTEVPGSRLVAPNGIAASADGQTLYVTGWGDGTLHVLPRRGRPRMTTLGAFRPDNIRVAPDGGLLVAGQAAAATEVLACGRHPVCGVTSRVLKVDPASLEATMLAEVPASPEFGGASVAIVVDDRLWLSGFRGDRIAIVSQR